MFRNDHDGQHDNDNGGARSGGWHSQYGQLAATTRHGKGNSQQGYNDDGHREETPHERRVRRRLEDAQERAWCVARIQKLDQEEADRQERKREWRKWNWAWKNLESNWEESVALLSNIKVKGKGKRGTTRPTPPSPPPEGYHGANAAVRGRGDTPRAKAFAADHTDTAVEDVRSGEDEGEEGGATASRDDAPSDDGRSSVHDAPRDDDAMETRSIGRHKEHSKRAPGQFNRSGLAPLSALRGDDRGSRPYLADDDDDNAYLDDDFESGPDAPEPDDRESAEEADREHEHSRKIKRSGLAPLSAVTKSQSQAQLSRSWSSAAVAVIGRGKDRKVKASKGTGN